MPSDIDSQSGFRLPLPKREDLDELGKRHYDRVAAPGASIAGLQGPSGIGLYSPKAAEHARALHRVMKVMRLVGAGDRHPDDRARDGQPVRMEGARA